ncbi:MAG: aminotransferase class I/II-fold pyridoxal phosphate-dependent enzyme, partial [Gemmatimonadaceae bacterium]
MAAIGQLLPSRGDPRDRLTEILRARFNAATVVLTGSGTQALHSAIAMTAAQAPPGSTVALPAFSCYDVASAAIGAGMPVALYDLDPSTLGPDRASLERVLQSGARVVVVA